MWGFVIVFRKMHETHCNYCISGCNKTKVSKLFPKEEARGIKGYLTVTDTAISICIDARKHALSLCLHVCLKYPDSH